MKENINIIICTLTALIFYFPRPILDTGTTSSLQTGTLFNRDFSSTEYGISNKMDCPNPDKPLIETNSYWYLIEDMKKGYFTLKEGLRGSHGLIVTNLSFMTSDAPGY